VRKRFRNGTLNADNLSLSSSTLTGSQAFNVTGATTFGGQSHLNAITLNANGTAGILNNSTLYLKGATTLNTNTLNFGNNTVLDIQETAAGSPTLNVTNFVFNGASGGSIYFEGRSGFNPVYTLNSGQTLSGNITGIGNSANIDRSPSTLNTAATIAPNVSGNTTILGGSVTTINNSGTIRSSNGNNLNIQSSVFTNSGTVDVGTGTTMSLTGGEVQTAGITHVNGTMALNNTTSLTLNGGSLTGSGSIVPNSGTISVVNNGGTVSPGFGYNVVYNSNDAVLFVTAAATETPEPGVWAMLAGLGLTSVSLLRRRRKK
jgi:fibronectin-binding autotransporter adhesin